MIFGGTMGDLEEERQLAQFADEELDSASVVPSVPAELAKCMNKGSNLSLIHI